MRKPLLIAVTAALTLLGFATAAEDREEAKGKKVDFEVYKSYFEKNNSGLKGELTYTVLKTREAFDKVFGPARVMGKQKFLPKDALEKQMVVTVIKRGSTLWKYNVEKVTADDDTLYIQYEATGEESKTAKYKSPLIVAVGKEKYKKVVFLENGKKVKTLELDLGEKDNGPKLPSYVKSKQKLSGTLDLLGSDALQNVMALLGERFETYYPKVTVNQGRGGGNPTNALIAGTVPFVYLTRTMQAGEIEEFKKKFGYEPIDLEIGMQVVAVVVHKDNPIAKKGLSLQQLKKVFSAEKNSIKTWGDLGLTDEGWKARTIQPYTPHPVSSWSGFFKSEVLKSGEFADKIKTKKGASRVASAVAADRGGIGITSLTCVTDRVLAVPLSTDKGTKPIAPSRTSVDGYPLGRYLHLYVNFAPAKGLDPVLGEFVRLLLSKEGQQVVLDDLFLPLSASNAESMLKKVGLAKARKSDKRQK
jgi:phosphate transport system substrate-binding protein